MDFAPVVPSSNPHRGSHLESAEAETHAGRVHTAGLGLFKARDKLTSAAALATKSSPRNPRRRCPVAVQNAQNQVAQRPCGGALASPELSGFHDRPCAQQSNRTAREGARSVSCTAAPLAVLLDQTDILDHSRVARITLGTAPLPLRPLTTTIQPAIPEAHGGLLAAQTAASSTVLKRCRP